ncbi:MAG TPA: alpha/beta hydrolase-fold protein [Labilithrix sp.]|nr:alpha/beta hydrolase-fold protein [Labilithrix sp.]
MEIKRFARTSLALGLLVLAACSSPASEPEPGLTPPAPTTAPAGTTPPAPTAPGTTPPPGPAITAVRVHYATTPALPGAMSLRGSAAPLSWDKSVATTSDKPGLFTWSATDLKTAIELKPMLGDSWARGPNYKVEPGKTIDIYPHFVQSHGTVTKKYPSFVSQKLPSTRGVWVYLPPTYVENTEARLGVLYMHDGANLFDPALAFGGNEWKVDETMDAGSEDGSIRETIVVGIESTAARISELTPTADPQNGGGHADDYLAMVVDEIKPLIDKDLRTVPGREQTAIMGSSLGGLVSAYAGVRRADVFGLVGEMSPSTWWDGTVILGEVSSTPMRPAKPLRVYVDSGDSGASNDDVVNTTELAARYRKAGYKDTKDLLHVVQAGAQHNEIYWAQRLPAALHFLLGARAN